MESLIAMDETHSSCTPNVTPEGKFPVMPSLYALREEQIYNNQGVFWREQRNDTINFERPFVTGIFLHVFHGGTGCEILDPFPPICLLLVLDESRSFFRVHTGYFSNIPKCIKAEFIASWACSQSSVVSSSKR
ncbi:hypothetical protein TNCV_2221721 [Trichonephila clavipes]|nr:hypothetical protein TNCV_2221721 [Trichonephila clavipes]